METVYVETTIPSYLTAQLSRHEPMKSHQKITRDWWLHERVHFRLYSSIAVRAEISKGDAGAAAKRLDAMAEIPELDLTPEVPILADSIVQLLQLPPKSTNGCDAPCLCHRTPDRLHSHVELHSSCQRHAAENPF
jgi:hypothetical protein